MEVTALAILIAAFVGGFLLAGRWANNVVRELARSFPNLLMNLGQQHESFLTIM